MTKNDNEALIRALLGTYFPWILLFLTLITTLTLMAIGTPIFDAYLRSAVFFMGGIQGVWAALAHLLNPEKTAAQIGWKTNGFQIEMGFTNLALAFQGY